MMGDGKEDDDDDDGADEAESDEDDDEAGISIKSSRLSLMEAPTRSSISSDSEFTGTRFLA